MKPFARFWTALAVVAIAAAATHAQRTAEELRQLALDGTQQAAREAAEDVLRLRIVAGLEATIDRADELLKEVQVSKDRLQDRVATLMHSDEGKRIGTVPAAAIFFLQLDDGTLSLDAELRSSREFVDRMKELMDSQSRSQTGFIPSQSMQTEADRVQFWAMQTLSDLKQRHAWLDEVVVQTRGVEHVDDLPTLNTRVTRARAVMMQAWIDAAEEGRAEAVEQIRPEVREQARLLEIERALHQSEMQRRQAERALERARLQDESVSMREDHELARIRLELQREATTNRQRELDYESQTKILEELTEENRRLREQLHEQEMRRSRDVSRATSDETRRLLEPVLALGTWQPGLRNPNPAGPMRPMSYGALLRSGALEPDENGLRNLMAIVNGRGVNWQGAMQTMHGQGNRRRHLDSMRPKLGFPARFNDLTTAQADHLWRMQKKLIELGPTLVELEMLAP